MSHHPVGIILSRCGYSILPTMEELAIKGLDENEQCVVPSLTIIRQGYGKLFFEGPLDVSNLNLDEIVFISQKEVSVYPDVKPPEGEGLNRKAEITFYGVWPLDWKTGKLITYPHYHRNRLILPRFEKRLANTLSHLKATFLSYEPEKGTLIFKVMNFTPYGLKFDGCLCIDTM